jgi:hypothetical protein
VRLRAPCAPRAEDPYIPELDCKLRVVVGLVVDDEDVRLVELVDLFCALVQEALQIDELALGERAKVSERGHARACACVM